MAVEYSPRFGVALWASDADDFSRTQMTTSHQAIEDLGAIFRQDEFANRGAASDWSRSFFYDNTGDVLYFSDGTNWLKLTDFGAAGSLIKVTPGDTANAGTADQAARIDHRHAVDPWGTDGQIAATSTSAAAGSLDAYARADHSHTIGAGSVVAGSLASGAINAANLFTANVVQTAAINSQAVTRDKISNDQRIPVGTVVAYVGATAPTGWLLCDGTSYPKTSYPALWTVLQTQDYGSSTNNFNVPDLRDRMPRGAATTETTLGVADGANTVTLVEAQLPSHNHGVGSISAATHANHSHSINFTSGTSNQNIDHTHGMLHNHTGYVNNHLVTGGGGGIGVEWYYPPGGAGNIYQDGPYSMFLGGGGPQAEIGVGSLLDRNLTISFSPTNTGSVNGGASVVNDHTHNVSGNTANLTTPSNQLSHTMSGSTANTGNGASIDIRPRTQTVNYIIKT